MSIEQTEYESAFASLDLSHEQRKSVVEQPAFVAIKIAYDQVIGRINDDLRKSGVASADSLKLLASTTLLVNERVSRLEIAVVAAKALVSNTQAKIQTAIGS